MKFLPDDQNEDASGHGAPHLRLHGVLAVAQEMLDPQVLLDPFEEQFDLPAVLVERADRQRRQCGVVGQEGQRLARLGVLEFDAPQVLGVIANRVLAGEHHELIADQAGVPVHRVDLP